MRLQVLNPGTIRDKKTNSPQAIKIAFFFTKKPKMLSVNSAWLGMQPVFLFSNKDTPHFHLLLRKAKCVHPNALLSGSTTENTKPHWSRCKFFDIKSQLHTCYVEEKESMSLECGSPKRCFSVFNECEKFASTPMWQRAFRLETV